ncbi:hypothetical protein NFI96_005161 [Prochilodus magdalenae]|nr:hypothetical protein NFI96_005161 [Prochilodus magdalenae]
MINSSFLIIAVGLFVRGTVHSASLTLPKGRLEEDSLRSGLGDDVVGAVGAGALPRFPLIEGRLADEDGTKRIFILPLEHPHTVPADGAVGVEVEGHQAFWTCDNKPFILVLTTVPPHTDSLGVSTKTKAGLVTEDDPLPF